MSRCEDFPCCGHELGCCPDFDESGQQLNMKCTCGATLPVDARYSICDVCLERSRREDDPNYDMDWPPDEEPEDNMTDVEADADTLRIAGMGTDEDYGYFGGDYE
jgi:hypothetical protein